MLYYLIFKTYQLKVHMISHFPSGLPSVKSTQNVYNNTTNVAWQDQCSLQAHPLPLPALLKIPG